MVSFIVLEGVSKIYKEAEGGIQALKGVSLQVEEGDFLAVMGPSGSGKSTLLTVLGAMNPPTEGRLTIDGIDVYSLSIDRQADFRHTYLGFVFQLHYLIPFLTAVENVMLPLVITSVNGSKYQLAREVLEKVGLGNKLDRLPTQLSGGEQARVAIARAIVNDPPIILADEPTGNLDSKTGEEVMSLLQTLNKEGSTVVMVTHNEANLKYAKRVLFLKDGEIEKVQEMQSSG